jgi:hypothetical protein
MGFLNTSPAINGVYRHFLNIRPDISDASRLTGRITITGITYCTRPARELGLA